jgi:N-methylhydantoinase A
VKLALLTTARFTDVLELARLKMPDPYDLLAVRPAPLIPKDMVFGIGGRVRADGGEDRPIDRAEVLEVAREARARGAEGIVVALLNAYRNPAQEHAVQAILRAEMPDLQVYCSADVWPVVREYERTITAVIHGYVQARVAHYLGSLQQALAREGVPAVAQVTKSNGGVMSAELGKTRCAQMILSGTASGVIGAAHVARLSGFPDTLSLDIGGTSADIAIIRDGQPQYGVGEVIGDFPIFLPTVAVTSIGAGGGSIAAVDELGVLRVGPESAGSTPGPACYGRGGERPTITDAMAVLGFIGQAELGYGAVKVDRARAVAAVGTVARAMGVPVEQAAEAIIRIAVSGMYLEVSKLISRAGIDPREFALQAFGGAGPMLACFLAAELGMTHVVVPTTPGVLSALGGLVADVKNDFIRTVYLDLEPAAMAEIQAGFAQLGADARRWLAEEQGHHGAFRLVASADMRYRGQSYEIETALAAADIDAGRTAALAEAFHAAHERMFGHCDRAAAVQVINLRMIIVADSPKPALARLAAATGPAAPLRHVDVHVGGAARAVPLYARADLLPGHDFSGPAIIAQDDTTTCVPDGFTGTVDAYGHLILTLTARN